VLGGLRFFLALIVAVSHLPYRGSAIEIVLFRLCGMSAVISFLLLSGYSIAASYEKDRNGFYFRRALRILPLYVLTVVASTFVPAITGTLAEMPGYRCFGHSGRRCLRLVLR